MKTLLVMLALTVVACGSKPATDPSAPNGSAPTSKATKVKKAGEATVGDTAECPVSGEEFDVTATSPKAEHDGKTYFFCCSGCKKKFEAEPAKYVKAKGPST